MRRRLLRLYDAALTVFSWGLFVLGLTLILARDVYVASDTPGCVLTYVREREFDFVTWTLEAVGFKIRQASVGEQAYLDDTERSRAVRRYFKFVSELEDVRRAIADKYADPTISDPAGATAGLRAQESDLKARAGELLPLAEAVLQEQISAILAEQGLVVGGQPIPPVSFHFTPLPLALIVSPRTVIRQDANLDLTGDLPLDAQVALEDRVARALDVATLIVPLGGIGTYPTMIAESSDLNWIASVGAHEWTHNYLTLRPLGIQYDAAPELRTMNETTASIMGNEIGALVIRRYYPDLAPPPPPFNNILSREQPAEAPPASSGFDFRAEMHTTRVRVDELLRQGQVTEAEAYMEQRRHIFWDHGYQIRKLNQAYFAFYGAYADVGGAPGADPVGPAVRLLRRRSPTLKTFLDTMATFTSFEQLQQFLGLRP